MRRALPLTMVGRAAAPHAIEITVAETGIIRQGWLVRRPSLPHRPERTPPTSTRRPNFNSTTAPLAKTSTNDDMDDDNDDLDRRTTLSRATSTVSAMRISRDGRETFGSAVDGGVEVRQLQSILLKVNTLPAGTVEREKPSAVPPNPSAMLLGAYVTALDWICEGHSDSSQERCVSLRRRSCRLSWLSEDVKKVRTLVMLSLVVLGMYTFIGCPTVSGSVVGVADGLRKRRTSGRNQGNVKHDKIFDDRDGYARRRGRRSVSVSNNKNRRTISSN
ncbi:hypothetical protein BV898_16104 [Hypsibius exemplaris]|uniref:Transmembrane protein n=1 Tax=Hypsibius exemplaris TaxID=2072580 RepID=A0A9X6NFB3_HYPEX|nr:hypothetical protein BV898_16104 [Hypsibius exemplaris]